VVAISRAGRHGGAHDVERLQVAPIAISSAIEEPLSSEHCVVYLDSSALVKLIVLERRIMLDAAGMTSLSSRDRSNAIHLAAAQLVAPSLTALVTYDRRLKDAAVSLGFPVVAPALGAIQ
jgi:hypothetical protein